jgi:preprotein translocase subunit YajC
MTAALTAVASLVAATSKPSSGGGSAFFYILILVGVAFYFFIYRPQQRKAKAAREQANQFEVGDEVLTAGGLVGHVIDIDGDRVTLETSVGASFVILKPYVLRKIDPPAADASEDEPGDDEGEDVHDDDDDATESDADDAGNADDHDRPPSA